MDLTVREPIIGRDAERSVLGRMVAGIVGGHGNLCWLQGEPGAGKSALVDAALADAAERGCLVVRGAGDEQAAAFPLRVLAESLGVFAPAPDPARAEIAGLLREPADQVLAASERMLELVDRLCAERPVVLAVEDMHWLDEPSLLLWNRLARTVAQIPLLLIGSARPVPRHPVLDRLRELIELRGGVVLELGPLDSESAEALAGSIVGRERGPCLQAVLARAGGNPLYLKELARALASDDPAGVPAPLRLAIEHRLRSFSAGVQAALRIAALMGNEFGAAEWAAATGSSAVQVADMVDAAAADGVLSAVGDRLRFRHQVVQEVLADQVHQDARRPPHAEIARKLAAAGYGVDVVARHLLAVPDAIGDWALAWIAELPESALYASPQISAELLAGAVASAGREDPRWEVLTARLSRVWFWLGRDDAAAGLAEAVAGQTSDHVLAARMRIQIIRSAARANHPERAAGALAGRPPDTELPALWQARLTAWSALLLRATGRTSDGAAMAADSVAMAAESGDPLAIACARYALAMCGGADGRAALIEGALATLTGQDPESAELRTVLAASLILHSADLGQQDGAALREGLALAERAGTVRAGAILIAAAEWGYQYGRWDDALTRLARIDRELSGTDRLRPRHGIAAAIALRRGDRAAADELLSDATGMPLPRGPVPCYPLTEALAMRAEADGDFALAAGLMSGWLSAAPGLGPYDRHADLPYLVYLALEADDTELARAAVAVSQADTAADGSPRRAVAARFCQALISDDVAALLEVADEYGSHGWLPARACALEEAAVRLAAAGEADRARLTLTDAARLYASLGAAWHLRRADTRLKRYGVRRGPNSIRRRPATGWGALTPSERRIAELVGRGLSNHDIAARLVLSHRTVETHVTRILAKLGLKSRVQIVRAAAERDGESRGGDHSSPLRMAKATACGRFLRFSRFSMAWMMFFTVRSE
jgi:DNA-binding NarL/FixJ family response regulator